MGYVDSFLIKYFIIFLYCIMFKYKETINVGYEPCEIRYPCGV